MSMKVSAVQVTLMVTNERAPNHSKDNDVVPNNNNNNKHNNNNATSTNRTKTTNNNTDNSGPHGYSVKVSGEAQPVVRIASRGPVGQEI